MGLNTSWPNASWAMHGSTEEFSTALTGPGGTYGFMYSLDVDPTTLITLKEPGYDALWNPYHFYSPLTLCLDQVISHLLATTRYPQGTHETEGSHQTTLDGAHENVASGKRLVQAHVIVATSGPCPSETKIFEVHYTLKPDHKQ